MPNLLPLKTKRNEVRESLTPHAVMLSNNKMRAVFSSLGHLALYDGLLPVVLSDFCLRTKDTGLCVTAETVHGVFSPFSVCDVPRGFRARYEFEKTEMQVRYTAHFTGKRTCFSLTVRFYLAPRESLFSVECSISGDIKTAVFSLSFSPVLKKTPRSAYRFYDSADEKERFFFRERIAEKGKGEPFYFGALVRGMGEMPIRFGTARERTRLRTERVSDGIFSLGVSRDIDDLLALLRRGRQGFSSYFGWEAILALQAAVSGFAGGAVTEEMLLTRMTLGQGRLAGTKSASARFDRALLRTVVPSEGPLILGIVTSADDKAIFRLRELSSLFLYMCIRGVPFGFLLLCRGDAVRRQIASALDEMGCAAFSFYAGGLYAVDTESLDPETLAAVKRCSVAWIDLESGTVFP